MYWTQFFASNNNYCFLLLLRSTSCIMGCCNCGCLLCGGPGNSLETLKVVELYVCPYQACRFSFLTLDEAIEHKLKMHNKDEENRFKKDSVTKSNRQMEKACSSNSELMSSQRCQVVLPRVDQAIAANLCTKFSGGLGKNDNRQPEHAGINLIADPQINHSFNFQSSDISASAEAKSHEADLSRLNCLSSLSVTIPKARKGSSVIEAKQLASKAEMTETLFAQHSCSTEEGENLSLSSVANPGPEANKSFNCNDKASTESDEKQFESLTQSNQSTMAPLPSASDFGLDDVDGDTVDSDNDTFDVPTIESDQEDNVEDEKRQARKWKNTTEPDSFKCMIQCCLYSTKEAAQLALHEKEEHFQWAHDACSANILKASDMLEETGSKWSCSKCKQKQFSRHEDATLHIINDHDLVGLDITKCCACAFTAKHPTILIKHFKVNIIHLLQSFYDK